MFAQHFPPREILSMNDDASPIFVHSVRVKNINKFRNGRASGGEMPWILHPIDGSGASLFPYLNKNENWFTKIDTGRCSRLSAFVCLSLFWNIQHSLLSHIFGDTAMYLIFDVSV